MTHRVPRAIAAASFVLSPLAFAQPKPPEAPPAAAASSFSLTIYSNADPGLFDPQEFAQSQVNGGPAYKLPGYGVVREVRKIDLIAGENTVKFTDVAAGIDPTTVSFKSLTAPDGADVIEQNYE